MSRTNDSYRPVSRNRLYRDPEAGKILGVCAGVGDYFGIDPWVVRLGTIFSALFFTVPTLVGYALAAWWLEPRPDDLYRSHEERDFWRGVRTEPSGTVHGLRHRFREMERRLRQIEAFVTSREFNLRRDIDGL